MIRLPDADLVLGIDPLTTLSWEPTPTGQRLKHGPYAVTQFKHERNACVAARYFPNGYHRIVYEQLTPTKFTVHSALDCKLGDFRHYKDFSDEIQAKTAFVRTLRESVGLSFEMMMLSQGVTICGP